MEIVKAGGLNPLLRLLQSPDPISISTATSCVSNLTLEPTNGTPIIEAGFLPPLVALLAFKGDEETQWNAARVLCKLAMNPGMSRWAVVNAGAVQSIKELVLEVSERIQIEMTGCIRNLSLSGMDPPFNRLLKPHPPIGDLKTRLSEMGINEVLILLANSPNLKVRDRSNAALQNLRNK